ncbi:MAG: VTT domain-containing protein [Candidatus Nanoarchaeia archaeon]|jgi:uncharacterized membrane protein YdjX (TVP38/TMEM64 family)
MISDLLAPIMVFLEGVVRTYGGVGVFTAMIVQAILVVIPSEGVLVVAGMLMSLWEVTFWAGLGSIAGASISFLIARKGGRPIVKKLLGEDTLSFMDGWVEKYGDKGVLIGRLIPFIPYDPISYLSGVTKMKFKNFTLYNIIGTIPRVIMFALLGNFAAQFEVLGIIIIAALMVSLLMASIYAKKKFAKKTKV